MKNKKKKRVFGSVYSVLLSSFVLVLLLSLASSFVFYSQINKKITSKNEVSKQLLLAQVQESWEQNTKEMERLVNELVFDTGLEQYVKGIDTTADLRAKLSAVRGKDNDFLLDKFFFFSGTGTVLADTHNSSAEQFFKIMYHFEGITKQELFEDVLKCNYFQSYLPVQNVKQYMENDKLVIPYVQSFPVRINSEIQGHIVCLIDVEGFTKLMEQLYINTGSSVYILNSSGEVMLSNSQAPILDAPALEMLHEENKVEGNIVIKQPSALRGWEFVMTTPKSIYDAENRSYLAMMLIVTAAFLLFGLLIVRFLAERNYRPIREINTMILNRTKLKNSPKNELENIHNTLIVQYQDKETMSEMLENQQPLVVKEMLSRLFTGMVQDYDAWKTRMEAIDVCFESDNFMILLVEIEEKSAFLQEGTMEESILLSRIVVQNVGSELLMKEFCCQYVEIGPTLCAFLINGKEGTLPAQNKETVARISMQLLEFAQKYELQLYMGLSSPHVAFQGVQLCYDESRKALEHSKLWADNPLVEFSELEGIDLDYYYPAETEYQLISFLRTGDYERAKQLIEQIFTTNAKEKNISVNAARSLIAEMNATLFRVLTGAQLSAGQPIVKITMDLERHLQNPSMEDVEVEFNEIIDQIEQSQAASGSNSKTARLVGKIAEYISSHVEDDALDLNSLSHRFELTPQYISNIFKRYKSENIKDYISKLRLERAKELLRTTDCSVNEIAQRLGYAGEIGIIRLFKKYENKTPGEYRNLHK